MLLRLKDIYKRYNRSSAHINLILNRGFLTRIYTENGVRVCSKEAKEYFQSIDDKRSLKPVEIDGKKYIYVKSFARKYGISVPTAYKMIRNGHQNISKHGQRMMLDEWNGKDAS